MTLILFQRELVTVASCAWKLGAHNGIFYSLRSLQTTTLWDSISSKNPESEKGNVILQKPNQITINNHYLKNYICCDFFSFYWVFAAIDMCSQHLPSAAWLLPCLWIKPMISTTVQCTTLHFGFAWIENILPYHWIH